MSLQANAIGRKQILLLKVLIHAICLFLLARVYFLGFTDRLGGDPVKSIIHYTGLGALNLLMLSLCVTPASRALKQPGLLRLRRLLGLYSFAWAATHLGNFIVFDLHLDPGLFRSELTRRPYILVGMSAFLVLTALAITSIPRVVRAMGRRWMTLHRAIYLAVLAACVHFYWSVKADVSEPLVYVLLAVLLLCLRLPSVMRRISRPPAGRSPLNINGTGEPLAAEGREQRSRSGALLVAIGILLSRLVGLVRQRVIAHYFGLQTDAADAWSAGFRIPNLLQNLFGEGALSASFIPVYAALLARGEREEAGRVAGAVASLLVLLLTVLVLLGLLAAPLLTGAIAPGFDGAKAALTVRVVQVLFPGAGLLVMSAWCLGVLNSHHRFLLSYMAPVTWSLAMIVALLVFGRSEPLDRLVVILAWASVVGSALQFAVQIPTIRRVAPRFRFAVDAGSEHVRAVIRNFLPALMSRGVVQISAYVDTLLASLLPTGAVAAMLNAQTLYTLPVSLFGISVSAAELPSMSGEAGRDDEAAARLRARLDAGLRQIALFVVPSSMAFLALGDVVAGGLLQTGRFGAEDAQLVWAILAGSAAGLLASTLGRLYSSTYYALRDTRTPLRCALVRVALATVLGYVCALMLPRALGLEAIWGTAGLSASASVAGWVEMLLLRRSLNARIGRTGLSAAYLGKLWLSALTGAAVAWCSKLALPPLGPVLVALAVLLPYGLTFFATAWALGVPEASAVIRRVLRRLRFSPGARRHAGE